MLNVIRIIVFSYFTGSHLSAERANLVKIKIVHIIVDQLGRSIFARLYAVTG
jgi:hypothetical protein